jgi:hypothetical protein
MPGHRTDLTKYLSQLLQQVMKETDPVEHDKLGAKIWRVLREQERLSGSRKTDSFQCSRLSVQPPRASRQDSRMTSFDVMTSPGAPPFVF